MATKKVKRQPRLTLHQLLGAISFWGASTRILLVAFIIAVIFGLRVGYLDTTLQWELSVVIYVLGSFALLDIGYVMLARAFPLRKKLDTILLLVIELALVLIYVLPNIAHTPGFSWLSNWTVLLVVLVLAIRGLLGMLFTRRRS